MRIVCITGDFNQLTESDIQFIKKAKLLGDRLYVIIYNDIQLQLKNNKMYTNEKERLAIIGAMKWVDSAMISIDTDLSVRKTLIHLQPHIFAYNSTNNIINYNDLGIITVNIL